MHLRFDFSDDREVLLLLCDLARQLCGVVRERGLVGGGDLGGLPEKLK